VGVGGGGGGGCGLSRCERLLAIGGTTGLLLVGATSIRKLKTLGISSRVK